MTVGHIPGGRSISRRRFLLIALTGGTAVALSSACQSTSAPPQPAATAPAQATTAVPAAAAPAQTRPATSGATQPTSGGRVVVAASEEEKTLDFHLSNQTIGRTIALNIGDGLLFQDDTTTLKPGLAERWENEDETTFLFHLRKGVTFHDGTPFNAQAVQYNFARLLNPDLKSPRASYYNMISSVEPVDDLTVRIKTSYPFAPLLSNLAYSNAHMVSPTAAEKLGRDDYGRNPVGTGPFKFKEWIPGQRLTLVAHDSYWRGRPGIDELAFTFGTDSATRASMLKTGQVHVAQELSPTELKGLQGDPNVDALELPWPSWVAVGKNLQKKPFDDLRVRQALEHAIDVDAILKNVLLGVGKRQVGPMSPGVFGFNPDLKPLAFDPARAKQLLSDAGYPNGVETDLLYESGRAAFKQVMEAIQGYLAAVNIQAKLIPAEPASAEQTKRAGNFQLTRDGWGGPTGDADNALYTKWHSSAFSPQGSNYEHYANPKVDTLLDDGRRTFDSKKREGIYQEATKLIHDDSVWTVLYQIVEVQGRSKKLQGVLFTTGYTLGFAQATLAA